MQWFVLTLVLCFPAAALADVTVVNIWDPIPGRAQETLQRGAEARAIHTELGAQVTIGVDQMGNMHYVSTFADWGAWAEFQAKMAASEEWQEWWGQRLANPSAELIKFYMINDATPSE